MPTEYAMAIARQEFELDACAASSAGARGLMQLMPGHRRAHGASRRAFPTSPARLTADPIYNARLGTEYLARMLARYDGSYVLATAAYNAGPGRVDQWLEANGDPRDAGVDPVIWIESIPFTETRNYVMRVLESLHVYRARLQGRSEPLRLIADLGAAPEVHVSTRNLEGEAAAAAMAAERDDEDPEWPRPTRCVDLPCGTSGANAFYSPRIRASNLRFRLDLYLKR